MRFKGFINEIIGIEKRLEFANFKMTNKEKEQLYKFAELIKRNCKQYFNDIMGFDKMSFNEFYMYSLKTGRNSKEYFFKKYIRRDRKPRDTPALVHIILDEEFYNKFGVAPRSNSLFCTSSKKVARRYGSNEFYYAFPIGKYEVIWSPKIKDLFEHLNTEIYLATDHEIDLNSFDDNFNEDYMDIIIEEIKKAVSTYKKGNLNAAIKSKNEVMLMCNTGVYMVSEVAIPLVWESLRGNKNENRR